MFLDSFSFNKKYLSIHAKHNEYALLLGLNHDPQVGNPIRNEAFYGLILSLVGT